MSTITVRDSGELKILKTFNVTIEVGILPEEAGQPHHSGMTIGQVGAVHEFGIGPIPARKWLRGWFELKEKETVASIRKELAAMVRTQTFIDGPLTAIAKAAERSVKGRIIGGHIEPGNAAITLKNKNPERRPLIETKQFLNAIKARFTTSFGSGQKLTPS